MSSVPSVVTPALARLPFGGASNWPSRITMPDGRPVASAKKSPLTPAMAAVGASLRCMPVRVSRPTIVSFETTGSSVVSPPGRGPRSTLIATGPCGVNCTSFS